MIDVLTTLQAKLIDWSEGIVSLIPNLVLALLVLGATFFTAKHVRRFTHRQVRSSNIKDTLNKLISTTSYLVIIILGGLIALEILQLDKAVTSLLAGAGIIGLALAFAFQDIASNFVSGIILAVKDMFSVGDLIETNGYFGTVKTVELRTTTIQRPSGQTVLIPNSDILSNPLENYSETKTRRVDIECGVSYDDDLAEATRTAKNTVRGLAFVNDEKDIDMFYKEFGGSSINFVLRFWIDFDKSNKPYLEAQSEAIKAIKQAFDEADIDIPYPIRTIDINDATRDALKER